MTEPAAFLDDATLQVGSVRFHCDLDVDHPPPGLLPVMKPRSLVEQLLGFLAEVEPAVVVEVGIKRGGSTALIHAVARPDRLVAIELEPEVPPLLAEYIEANGCTDAVRPHVGVDQADRERVAAIMSAELGGRPIDLVVDDASHLLAETRTTFEVLFPLVRPGGLYVIEDWQGDRLLADAIAARVAEPDGAGAAELTARMIASGWAPEPAAGPGEPGPATLLQLPLELVLARASSADAIRSLTVMDHVIVVRRGEDHLEPGAFRLADLVGSSAYLLPGG